MVQGRIKNHNGMFIMLILNNTCCREKQLDGSWPLRQIVLSCSLLQKFPAAYRHGRSMSEHSTWLTLNALIIDLVDVRQPGNV